MSLDTPNTNDLKRAPRGESRTMTENEDAIRNLKASQSVEAAFMAVRMPSPPSDIAAIITSQVKSAIKAMPLSQVANMTPGSGALSGAATAAVEQYLGMLSPSQRHAAEQGVNNLGPAAMIQFTAMFQQRDAGSSNSDARSSSKYDSISAGNDWSSPAGQAQMRELAIKSGLSWAANNPDLLRLGPSAIQALADVHMQKQTFDQFKKGGLSDKSVVDGARWFKDKGVDAKKAGDAYEETQKVLSPAEQQEHNRLLDNMWKSKDLPHEQQDAAKAQYQQGMTRFGKAHPQAKPTIDNEEQVMKAKQQEATATSAATATLVSTTTDKVAKVDDAQAKMAELLKKRLAAQAAPKPAG